MSFRLFEDPIGNLGRPERIGENLRPRAKMLPIMELRLALTSLTVSLSIAESRCLEFE